MESPLRTISRGGRYAVGAALVLFLAAWTFGRLWSHPEELLNWRFLSHDLANQLHLSDELLAGKKLYSGVFTQYGPLPAYVNALAAWLFGNTALTFIVLQGCLGIVCLLQLYVLLRRIAPGWWAILFAAIALLPWVPSLAGGPGAYLQPYGGIERIVLLAIALAWRPLTERTGVRNFALGLLLGVLPWVKFGSAFIAGAALLGAEILVLIHREEFRRRHWPTIAVANAWILAGFVAGQGTLAIYLALTQSPVIARDVLWPSYMLENYAGYVTSDIRFMQWQNRGYFLGAQLPVVAAVLSFIFLLWRAVVRSTRISAQALPDRPEFGLGAFSFLFLFWFIGLGGYLAHVWLIMGYAWLPMAGAGYALTFLRPRFRLVALCLWLPCFVLTAKGLAPGPVPTEVAPVTFENGETLWLDATWRRRVTLLSAFLQKEPKPARTIMGFSTGGGIAHYFGCRLLTRQSWFMAGFVRPYDEEEIRASLPRTKALIVLLDKPMEFPFSSNANRWGFGPMFSDALATEIPNRFATSVKLDACCWVLPATRNVSTR